MENITLRGYKKPSVCPMCRTLNSFEESGDNWECRVCEHTLPKGEMFDASPKNTQTSETPVQVIENNRNYETENANNPKVIISTVFFILTTIIHLFLVFNVGFNATNADDLVVICYLAAGCSFFHFLIIMVIHFSGRFLVGAAITHLVCVVGFISWYGATDEASIGTGLFMIFLYIMYVILGMSPNLLISDIVDKRRNK